MKPLTLVHVHGWLLERPHEVTEADLIMEIEFSFQWATEECSRVFGDGDLSQLSGKIFTEGDYAEYLYELC